MPSHYEAPSSAFRSLAKFGLGGNKAEKKKGSKLRQAPVRRASGPKHDGGPPSPSQSQSPPPNRHGSAGKKRAHSRHGSANEARDAVPLAAAAAAASFGSNSSILERIEAKKEKSGGVSGGAVSGVPFKRLTAGERVDR